jgi:hypothetical protein
VRRTAFRWGLALSLAAAACSRRDDVPATTDNATPLDATESLGAAEHAPVEVEATLRSRDVPLGVGDRAPWFEGYPERAKAVIVFFRGAW